MQSDTKNQLFREVMGNGLKYKVPKFQRDYSWSEEQWEELWQDILEASLDRPHYMGYLVLQSGDSKNFEVIDGQQRLTTLSILVLSALYELAELIKNNVEKEDNEKRKQTLFHSFIGFVDPVSLSLENKLTLNRNNRRYFSSYLCKLSDPPVSKISESEKLMGKALKYFREKLKNHVEPKRAGASIAELIDNMAGNLRFTTMTVGDVGKAYTIFETLNARGVQLSTPDLVKNYLFSLIDKGGAHSQAIQQLEDSWSAIIDQLGHLKFSNFIRADWNSRYEFSRQAELFKKIRSKLDTAKKAQSYLEHLKGNAEIYRAIQNEDDEFWISYKNGEYNDEKLKMRIQALRLFNIVAPHSALLAAFHKLDKSDFIKFLRYVEALSIRNMICSLSPARQERPYCEAAIVIAASHESRLKKARALFKGIYPSDEEFKSAFARKGIKKEKQARYILYRIERHLQNDSATFEKTSLEHIFPKNPTEEWLGCLANDNSEEYIHLFGNLAILSKGENKSIGRKPFKDKKEIFKKSAFATSKKCADYEKWNEESIRDRQAWLGEKAKSLWAISDF